MNPIRGVDYLHFEGCIGYHLNIIVIQQQKKNGKMQPLLYPYCESSDIVPSLSRLLTDWFGRCENYKIPHFNQNMDFKAFFDSFFLLRV